MVYSPCAAFSGRVPDGAAWLRVSGNPDQHVADFELGSGNYEVPVETGDRDVLACRADVYRMPFGMKSPNTLERKETDGPARSSMMNSVRLAVTEEPVRGH